MYLTRKSVVSVFAEPLRLVGRNRERTPEGSFDMSRASNSHSLGLFTRTLDNSNMNGALINSFDNFGQPKTEDASGTTDHPAISTFAALDAMFRVKKFFESFDAEGKLIKVGKDSSDQDYDFYQKFLENFDLVKNLVMDIARAKADQVDNVIQQAKRITSMWLESIQNDQDGSYKFNGKSFADGEFDTTEDWRKLQQELASGVGS